MLLMKRRFAPQALRRRLVFFFQFSFLLLSFLLPCVLFRLVFFLPVFFLPVLRNEISSYASYIETEKRGYDNDGELIAESFAYVWYNGSGQNQLADAVVDALLRRLEQ